MTVDLLYSVTILLSLSLLYGFIIHYFYTSHITRQVLSGILFGGICVIGMILPIEISPGVIIDPRSVVLGIAGLFGGPIGATIAAIIGGGYRFYLGGAGMLLGVQLVIFSTCLGLAYRYAIDKGWAKINVPQLLLFGLAVHLVQILLLTQLPSPFVEQVMSTVVIPLLFIFTPATAFLGMLLNDAEDRFRTEQALRESESQLSHHLHNTPLAAITWDVNFHCMQWNKTAETIFGYTAEEVMGKHPLGLIIDTGTNEEIDGVFKALVNQKGGVRSTNYNITKDGRKIACEWYNTPLLNSSGKLIGVASLCEDVTARKESERMIWQQAHFDTLTGLANRQMANDHLEQEIKIADRSNKSIAYLFLDLDGFKHINDTLGHDVGDQLLIEAAKRLRGYTREVDTIARLGGDEFVIIMGGLESLYQVDKIANDLLKKMSEPFKLGDEIAYTSTSIGITLYPQDASNPIEMLRNADQAMYAAKHNGGNSFQYFTPLMQQNAISRMSVINDLRIAIPDNQFQLYYQPIVNLNNNEIHKAEALIRWHHPEKGLITPFEFIPIAEESMLIIDITEWVFNAACRQTALWRESLHSNFQISINTSPKQYKTESFKVKQWIEHLHALKLPGDAIAIEITEGTLIEPGTRIDNALFDLRDANIQVALDDFGTGYSSLSLLNKLDIDYLKIDKSFVDNLGTDPNDLALCEAIIVMAHKLGLKVIAEGIETQQQKDILTAAECDYGQGYLFSKALPAKEFEAFFANR
jgi:diguanylate cyclase (GGDEF)-like protein/PAS domain S-box-containing protein